MRILVTGGAGFIGSHVADALLASGHEVRVLDALLPIAHAAEKPPAYLDPGVELVIGDVRDASTVRRCLDGVDALCHQAAMVGLGVDLADITAYVGHNDLGTAVLLRALHQHGGIGRLVLASSMVVYGEGGYRCAEHGVVRPPPRREADLSAGRFEPRCPDCGADLMVEQVDEQAPLDPRNVYAATKLAQEHLCAAWARAAGTAVTALRYHNVYGPRMPRNTPYAGVASLFRSALEAGQAPRVFEDGRQLRDFVHVRDVAAVNVLALERPEPYDGPLNVASGDPHTVGEMASALAAAYNGGQGVGPAPVVTGQFRLGDVRHVVARPALAAKVLGYRAAETFAAGMAEFATATLR